MRSSWMVRVLVASASAVCFILQTVFFCSNKKPFFKPVSNTHRRTASGCYQSSNVAKGRQHSTNGTPEEEALLANEQCHSDEHQHESQPVQQISRQEQRISRVGSNAKLQTNPITRNEDGPASTAAAPHSATDAKDISLEIDTQPESVQAQDGLPAASDASNVQTAENAIAAQPPAQQQQADASAAPACKQNIEPSGLNLRKQVQSESDLPLDGNAFLQHLIDAQLGQPRFPVPKDSQQARHKPATHSRTPGSLQALLDDQFGPPKFAVPKADAPADEVAAAKTDEQARTVESHESSRPISSMLNGTLSQVLEEESPVTMPAPDEKRHLRLEVLTGPLQGHVFDTVDDTQEVRIGRSTDCALSLADDGEVSGNHAVIQYHKADNCWKMKDVGSLNGSSLNGATLSSNRQPSQPHALATGDIMEFGSITRVQVTCTPSHIREPNKTDVGVEHSQQPHAVMPHFGSVNAPIAGSALSLPNDFSRKAHTAGRVPVHSPSPNLSRSGTGLTAHMMSHVGPPLAVRHHQQLGISLAVQQRLGTEHRRQNTGCEDVVHFELPWQLVENSPAAATSALFALFDGHQGVNAAQRAKEVLPQVLREKLLQSASGGSHGSGGQLPRSYTYHSSNNSHGTGLVLGRPASAQAALLRDTFLEIDARIAMDEGCTATLLVLERDPLGRCVLQSANVGDSSAVLVQLPTPMDSKCLISNTDSMPTARSGNKGKPPMPKPPTSSKPAAQPGSPANHQPPSLLLPDAINNVAVAQVSGTQLSPRNSSTASSQEHPPSQPSRLSAEHLSQQSDPVDEQQGRHASMSNRELQHSLTRRSTSGNSGDLGDCQVSAATEETAIVQPPQSPSNMSSEQPTTDIHQQGSKTVLDASSSVQVPSHIHSSQLTQQGQTNGIAKLRGVTTVNNNHSSAAVPLPPGVEGGHLEGGGHWIKMSEDHRISTSEKERDRLAQLGHKTVKTRLYGLNIARMLGDKFLKDERIGFIAEPHVSPPLLVAGPGCHGTTVYDTQGLQQASPAMLQGSPATSRPPKNNARRRRGAPLSQLFATDTELAPEAAADAVDKQTAVAGTLSTQPVNQPVADITFGKSSPRRAANHATTAADLIHNNNGSSSQGKSSSLPPLQPMNSNAANKADGDSAMGRTFVVVASDGLWDVISEGKAASILTKQCTLDPGTSVAELASMLLSQAVNARSKDDITVMVLEIHPTPDL